jgi:hypothetical protein
MNMNFKLNLGGLIMHPDKKSIGYHVMLILAGCALIFLAAAPAWATVYYVDGANGNDANPGTAIGAAWKTIHKANQTLMPGDTVYMRGGTYYVGNLLGYSGADPAKQGINPKNSGTSGNPITYTNYNGEDVQFVGADKYCWAVKLFNGIQDNPIPTDHIVVKGLHYTNFFKFLWILKSSHCEVAYCTFQKSRDFVDWRGSTIYKNAQHNHIHHCTFSEYGNFVGLDDNGVLLEIGNEYAPANDLTSFNLIEDCHLYHSGHHVVGLMGSNNVLRNNYIHNENWWEDSANNCKWGNRIVYMQSDGSGEGVMCNRRNLVEGNRIAFGGETAETIDPNDYQVGGGGISKFSMPYNIVRKNMLYYTLTSGMFFQTYHHGNVVYNHVYHNVFFRNGYSDNPKIGNSGGHAIFFNFNQGPDPICNYEQYGNCIKNNIFHDNRNRSNKTEPIIGACYAGKIIYPPFPTNTIENNWKEQGDPLFVDDGGPMDPSFIHDGTPPIDPFGPQPDFRLQANSPCRDAGGFLTTVLSPGGSGTSFQVADAGYFMDGWGIEHVQGDLIQLAGQTQRSRITNVNYETNTITVDTPLTWTQGQGVSLAYEGSAPDIGAYESPQAISQSMSLQPGWNWISFNVLPTDLSLNSIFTSVLNNVEQVKAQTQSAIRSSGNWKGDLADMNGIGQNKMFKVKVSAARTLTVIGSAISPTMSISLVTGWNWVAYLPTTAMPIATALASISGQVLEVKSLTQSATFNGTTWSGTLAQLQPGQGYAIKMSGLGTLIYPAVGAYNHTPIFRKE